jgi:ferredoxin-nitrite reductase
LSWPIQANVCPGLFYGTPAQDGYLMRIRVPGGLLRQAQGQFLAQLLPDLAPTATPALLQVTNRGNLQVRGLERAPNPEILHTLQTLGLAARYPQVDHLRNLMASPTAGIDLAELLDSLPIVQALDAYIQTQPELAQLPAKFSIGIDGGGAVAIGQRSPRPWEHRYNEIQLSAVRYPAASHRVYLHLALGADQQLLDTRVLIDPDACLPVVAALTQAYLAYLQQAPISAKPPRMKHLLADWGLERYLATVNQHLCQALWRVTDWQGLPSASAYGHLGVHPQGQAGLSYVGVSLPLGQLSISQLLGLLELSARFGDGQLRLTPWQTVLLPNIANSGLPELLLALAQIGFSVALHATQAIVACAGKPGCAASATHTQAHAMALTAHLNSGLQPELSLATPINIHFTGCPKSCAQPSPAEITLLGTTDPTGAETYQIYVGDAQQSCKCGLGDIAAAAVPETIAQLLAQYQQQRLTPRESLTAFFQRLTLADSAALEPV